MILDPNIVVALATGLIATCLFRLHAITSPKHELWFTPPQYVRFGFLLGGTACMWRCVNIVTLFGSVEPVRGMANAEAAIAWLAMAYGIGSVTLWVWTAQMPGHGWDRVRWVLSSLKQRPTSAPIMVDPVEVAHAAGIRAVGPGEGPDAVRREMAYRGER